MIIYMRKKCLYLISKTNINTTGTTGLNTQHTTRPRRERAGDAGVGRTSLNRSEDVQRRATQPVYFPLLFLGGPPWVRALSLQSDLGPPSASGLEVGRGRRPDLALGSGWRVRAGPGRITTRFPESPWSGERDSVTSSSTQKGLSPAAAGSLFVARGRGFHTHWACPHTRPGTRGEDRGAGTVV